MSGILEAEGDAETNMRFYMVYLRCYSIYFRGRIAIERLDEEDVVGQNITSNVLEATDLCLSEIS